MGVLLTLAVASPLLSQRSPGFRHQRMHVRGQVASVTLTDMNADGEKDLIVLHNHTDPFTRDTHRFLTTILQSSSAFTDTIRQTLVLDSGEILFDVGDVDGDGIPEIVFLKRDGIYLFRQVGGRFAGSPLKIIHSASILPAHDPSVIKRYSILNDLDSDGRPELMVPSQDGFEIHSRDDDERWSLWKRLWWPSRIALSESNALGYSFRLPAVRIADFNADSTADVLLVAGDGLDVYLQHRSTEKLAEARWIPPDLRYSFSARNISPSVLEPLAPGSFHLELHDLNRDGNIDLLLSKSPRAGFTKNIRQIQVYMNSGGRFDCVPDHILTSESVGGEHLVADVNQDGLLDIAPLTFKIGFPQILRFLLTKKAVNAFEFYTMREDHSYPIKPDLKVSFSREVLLEDILNGNLCRNLDGDFDGDGRDDLLIGVGIEHIRIIPHGRDGRFDKKAALRFNVRASDHILVQDINQDGISDVVLWYPRNTDPSSGLIHLILSSAE